MDETIAKVFVQINIMFNNITTYLSVIVNVFIKLLPKRFPVVARAGSSFSDLI